MAATADTTPINEAEFSAYLKRAGHVDDLCRDGLDVLPQQAVDDHEEKEPHNEGIYEGKPMSKDELSRESGFSGRTHHDVRRLIHKALEEQEQAVMKRLIEDRCRNVVLELFEEAHEQTKRHFYSPVLGFSERRL